MSALTSTVVDVVVFKEAKAVNSSRTPELLKKIGDIHHYVYNVIGGRIYIAKDVEILNAFNRYMKILAELRESKGETGPAEQMSTLISETVAVANRG